MRGAVASQPQLFWTPIQLPGLMSWWDASDLSTITASSGLVSQWRDKSGAARHMAQATGTNQPTTGTRTQNGLNVLDFDGTTDYMSTAVAAYSEVSPYSIFVAFKNDVGANSLTNIVVRCVDGTAAGSISKDSTNTWRMNAGTAIAGGTPDANPHGISAIFNSTSSYLRLDGTVLGGPTNVGTAGFTQYRVGANNSATSPWDGFVCEIIMSTNAIGDPDVLLVENYLRVKWGLP